MRYSVLVLFFSFTLQVSFSMGFAHSEEDLFELRDTIGFKNDESNVYLVLLRANTFDYKSHVQTIEKFNEFSNFKEKVGDVRALNGVEVFIFIKPFFGEENAQSYLKKLEKNTSLSAVLISQYNWRVILSGQYDFDDYLEFYGTSNLGKE